MMIELAFVSAMVEVFGALLLFLNYKLKLAVAGAGSSQTWRDRYRRETFSGPYSVS